MSNDKSRANFRNSHHFKDGEPFKVSDVLNATRLAKARCLQIIAEMVKNKEIDKIGDDTYRRHRGSKDPIRCLWRKHSNEDIGINWNQHTSEIVNDAEYA